MPFKSKAQMKFMFSKHPEMAKEWADKTPDMAKLPERKKRHRKHHKNAYEMLKGAEE